ncbi:hypothetical protein Acsp05_60820 [Actinokineospora sp. NBRC 105648]|nr:hypothetical protein Acsp05_60820 [Actinokineospora sp. NBRC 105648]
MLLWGLVLAVALGLVVFSARFFYGLANIFVDRIRARMNKDASMRTAVYVEAESPAGGNLTNVARADCLKTVIQIGTVYGGLATGDHSSNDPVCPECARKPSY